MEDLPEGKVSDPVDEIDGMNGVWRRELAEGYLGRGAEVSSFLFHRKLRPMKQKSAPQGCALGAKVDGC